MKQRITFLLEYFVLWWAYFISSRTLFLAYLHESCSTIDLSELLKTFIYGTRLDFSATAYICIIPFVIMLFSSIEGNTTKLNKYLRLYSVFSVVLLSIIIALDPEFYAHWGFIKWQKANLFFIYLYSLIPYNTSFIFDPLISTGL